MQYSRLNYDNKEYVQVGWVKDAHGIKGELFIHLMSGQADWRAGFKSFLLKSSSSTQEFSVSQVRPHKTGLIILSPGFSDRTQAESFKRYEFLIPQDLLESTEGEAAYLDEIRDFQMKDLNSGEEGKIVGFESNGLQDLLIVENERGRFLVPYVEDFIKEIRFSDKELIMDLPEGLLEV